MLPDHVTLFESIKFEKPEISFILLDCKPVIVIFQSIVLLKTQLNFTISPEEKSGVLLTNIKASVIEKVPYKSFIEGPSTSSLVHPFKKKRKTKKGIICLIVLIT